MMKVLLTPFETLQDGGRREQSVTSDEPRIVQHADF